MSSIGGFKRRTPKSLKTRRALRKYEPKVVENPKRLLFLRGAHTSEVITDAMTDLFAITRPHCKKLRKRNAFHPFESPEHLEFLGFKNDSSLFCFGSDSKKRPHNLVLGRHFDFHLLDMVELGILAADRLDLSGVAGMDTASLGGRPLLVFEGSEFEGDPSLSRLRNLLLDLFRGGGEGEEALVDLDGCDRVLAFSLRAVRPTDAPNANPTNAHQTEKEEAVGGVLGEAGGAVLCVRHYALLKPSTASGVPRGFGAAAKLVDIGPNFDFLLRRMQFASPAAFKTATRLPKQTEAARRATAENVTSDAMKNLRGQLHVGKQDIGELNLRRFKAHRKTTREENGEENGEENEEEEPRKRRKHKKAKADAEEEGRPETDI